MSFKILLGTLTLCTATLSAIALADDTDIFLADPTITEVPLNVLIVLDNTSNWSSGNPTQFFFERQALATVASGIGSELFNLGLMLFSETGSGNPNPSGGYVRYAVRSMNSTNKTSLVNLVNSLKEGEDKGNSAEYALAMHEAYLYFKGMAARGGIKAKTDSAAFASDTTYASPITYGCAKNFIIFISNGPPDQGENNTAESLLASLGGNTTQIPLSPSGRQANWADEYARFMRGHDILTYTIDVNPKTGGQGPDNTALLRSMARQGKGRYFTATDTTSLVEALNTIFSEIQAINSVFTAVSLPVSVNVRGTNLNQVYMGMFRPDEWKQPRWFGNLKLYQLALDNATNSLFLADKNGLTAQSPTTGFIVHNAVSFWTQSSSFWDYDPRGTPLSGSDSPDGEVVEKGGAAQRLRTAYPTRNLYTCTGSCPSQSLLSTTLFSTENSGITETALGVADATARTNLINWVRGADNKGSPEGSSERIPIATNNVRPSIHGDVIHSRPAVINYNRTGSDNDIVVFYGANDGIFHAVKGGKTDSDGGELWGFIPQEFFGQLKRLRDNTQINTTNGPKPYFVDGSVDVYSYDANNDGKLVATAGDKVHLYLSMRRGGRFIYALDVSDPEAPTFLWKRSHTDTGYAELGQTWSEPKVAKINLNGTATPVLIFGAGYDPAAEDTIPAGTATMGRGVLVVNALTGDVIWQAGPSPSGASHNKTVAEMIYSIPSDVTIINRDGDANGYADRAYVGDTGGNVWRIDIGDTDPDNWGVHKLAAIGGTGADARKFLYPPDVVYDQDAGGDYDAVLMGSGDREHPFDTTVINRFYMFKDRHTGPSGAGQATITESDLYDATENLIQVGSDTQPATAQSALLAAKGWYITLGTGEKVVGSAITLSGGTFFNTNQPAPASAGSCSNLGIARNYIVNFKDAAAIMDLDGMEGLTTPDRHTQVPGGGYLPSPVPVIVEIDGKKYQAVVSGTGVLTPPGVELESRKRVYWYKEMD